MHGQRDAGDPGSVAGGPAPEPAPAVIVDQSEDLLAAHRVADDVPRQLRDRGGDDGQCGFPSTDLAVVATAISELARNIVRYAVRGEVILRLIDDNGRRGVEVVATDDGPGIPDITLAMQDGYSTSGSLGLGLPGVRRLMDEFEITSDFGKGTTVTARKWER